MFGEALFGVWAMYFWLAYSMFCMTWEARRERWAFFWLWAAIYLLNVAALWIRMKTRRMEWDSLEQLLRSGGYLSPLPSDFRKGRLTQSRLQQYLRLNSQSLLAGNVMEAEDREEPVIGFRVWKLSPGDDSLRSVAMFYKWDFERNVAKCGPGGDNGVHDFAPADDGNCGLYVQATVEQARSMIISYEAGVIGAVMGWGVVLQHGPHGWRAQYAKPIALLTPGAYGETARKVAAAGKIPIFDTAKGIEAYAEEYGKSLPGQREKKKAVE